LLALTAGCSSTLKVEDISPLMISQAQAATTASSPPTTAQAAPTTDAKPSVALAGLPFRVPNVYTVRVFQKQKDGDYKQVERHFVKVLPDPKKLYALNVDSKLMSQGTLDVKIRADGTLDFVHLHDVEFRGDEALTAFGTQATALYEAIENRDLIALETQKAAIEAKKNLLVSEAALEEQADKPADDLDAALIAALEALNEANSAYDALEGLQSQTAPPPTATEVRAAERALLLARVKANQAYRRADLPVPFPGVNFP
jgi:hypothetical protein